MLDEAPGILKTEVDVVVSQFGDVHFKKASEKVNFQFFLRLRIEVYSRFESNVNEALEKLYSSPLCMILTTVANICFPSNVNRALKFNFFFANPSCNYYQHRRKCRRTIVMKFPLARKVNTGSKPLARFNARSIIRRQGLTR